MADQQQNEDSKPLTDIELERLKMYQDSFKHMTTFCSGGILLASAVTGALFLPKPDVVALLAMSIFLLAIGAGTAMFGLGLVPQTITSEDIDFITARLSFMNSLLWFSVGGAYFGLAIFSLFAGLNLGP